MPRGPKGEKRPGDVIGNPNKVAHIVRTAARSRMTCSLSLC